MPEIKRVRLVRRKSVRSYGGRGPIYAWLRAHHREIEALRSTHLNLWAELSIDMVDDGIAEAADGRGLRHKIWQVWQRVARDVEAEAKGKAAAAAKSGGMPSRMSASWRPTEVAPTGAQAVAVAAPRYGASPSTALTPTQPISGSQNSPAKLSPPDFPTVDPAGNPLADGYVWFKDKASLRHVAVRVWEALEEAKQFDLRRQGLA